MDKNKLIEFLDSSFIGAGLDGFGIVNQFLELKFSSEKHEKIKFFIDCDIYFEDNKLNQQINDFKEIDNDVYIVIHFVFVNRKRITKYSFIQKNILSITFSNSITILFDLDKQEDPSLAITFKKYEDDNHYSYLELDNDGIVQFGINE